MGLKSFKESEKTDIITLPNAMTGTRLVGGVALGLALATHNVDPLAATLAAGALGATDAEGNVIDMVAKRPRLHRLRDRLRIFPSLLGRKGDPTADKVFGLSALIGGMVGGYIALSHGLPIVATEAGTASATIWGETHGKEAQVSLQGKAGLLARVGVIMVDLINNDVHGKAHELIHQTANVGALTAITLGAWSMVDIIRQNNRPITETVPTPLEPAPFPAE